MEFPSLCIWLSKMNESDKYKRHPIFDCPNVRHCCGLVERGGVAAGWPDNGDGRSAGGEDRHVRGAGDNSEEM